MEALHRGQGAQVVTAQELQWPGNEPDEPTPAGVLNARGRVTNAHRHFGVASFHTQFGEKAQ